MPKTRRGFISNSSSSSFIVIGDNINIPFFDEQILKIPESFEGEDEFGWQIDDHTDIGSRINFALLQAELVDGEDYKEMLNSVLEDKFDVCDIEYNMTGYIDHQSVGGDNIRMFESEETLIRFIFGEDSYVHTDNDNH